MNLETKFIVGLTVLGGALLVVCAIVCAVVCATSLKALWQLERAGDTVRQRRQEHASWGTK